MTPQVEVKHPLVRVTDLLMFTPLWLDVGWSWKGGSLGEVELSDMCLYSLQMWWLLKIRTLNTCDSYVDV